MPKQNPGGAQPHFNQRMPVGAFVDWSSFESSSAANGSPAATAFIKYPVGVTDVPNRLGRSDVHLILVGNDYDDLGVQ